MVFDPKSGGGVDRTPSANALGSQFEPRFFYKYIYSTPITPIPRGLHTRQPSTPQTREFENGSGLTTTKKGMVFGMNNFIKKEVVCMVAFMGPRPTMLNLY